MFEKRIFLCCIGLTPFFETLRLHVNFCLLVGELVLEKYAESDKDMNKLERESFFVRFLVTDLWIEILRLALQVSFSLPRRFFELPVK